MSQLLLLDSYSSDTGDLTVFERIFPEHIKRVCFIQGYDNITYGGYRHKSTKLALVCLSETVASIAKIPLYKKNLCWIQHRNACFYVQMTGF
jgi:hypothetical protein